MCLQVASELSAVKKIKINLRMKIRSLEKKALSDQPKLD